MPEGPLGFGVEQDDDLVIPVKLTNEDDFREIMSRESLFSFPAAAVGTAVAGPAGTVAGHVTGTAIGFVRHKRIHPDDDIFEPERPGAVEDE